MGRRRSFNTWKKFMAIYIYIHSIYMSIGIYVIYSCLTYWIWSTCSEPAVLPWKVKGGKLSVKLVKSLISALFELVLFPSASICCHRFIFLRSKVGQWKKGVKYWHSLLALLLHLCTFARIIYRLRAFFKFKSWLSTPVSKDSNAGSSREKKLPDPQKKFRIRKL